MYRTTALIGWGCLVILLGAPRTAMPEGTTLYVAVDGSDRWSGKSAAPNADRSDGPLATVKAARDKIRQLRAGSTPIGGPVTVNIRGGFYELAEPLVLEPQDSGTAESPVVYQAYAGEHPVLSGGRRIRGLQAGQGGVWTAEIPEVASGAWHFHQLFVGGQRRTRARTPNDGCFSIAAKAPPAKDAATGKEIPRTNTAFVYAESELKAWPDLAESNVIVYHSWETSRLRVAAIDEAQRIVSFTGPAAWPFENWGPKQRYFVENVRAALDAPGEWHLDRQGGKLSYLPKAGEAIASAEVIAPRLDRLVELRGVADQGKFVEHVTLRGLCFSHADWTLAPQGHSDAQAAVSVPAAVMADGARHCTIEGCEVSHVGGYGLWLRRGCKDCRVTGTRLCDLGAGGIRVGEAARAAADEAESSGNAIDNNHIFDGGHVYPAGVGVWVAQSSGNTISHNEIHDLFYSGMSVGWNWDDAPNRCHHNTIERNHVHHVMKGVLSDGGAIYTLGASPGSVIRNNRFHDVWPYHQPPFGWGIYLDATTSGYLVENNVVYHTLSGGMMYSNGGHENVIRNNVFALSANQMLWPYWEKRPNTFQRNLVYLTQGDLFVPFAQRSLRERIAAKESLGAWDENLYWHTSGPESLRFFGETFAQWQAKGLDGRSKIADPEFVDPAEGDFRLKPTSPAPALGFQPIDVSDAGLYGDPAWVAEARQVRHPPTEMPPPPPPPQPREVNDDFEKTALGASPDGAIVSGEGQGASIRVTDEQAASGSRCLKVADAKAVEPSWQPHIFYQPHLTAGTVRQSFDVRLTPGAMFFTEWRDDTAYPACIGPSVALDASGAVSAGGKRLATVPVEGWIHVEIEAKLGKEAPKTFSLTVAPAGKPASVFADLPFAGADFQALHWLGFVSTAAADTVFFLDNLHVRRVDGGCVLSSADTMQKVFRDEPWTRPRAEKLAVEAARNETEGIQLVVVPAGQGGVQGATVEISDLAGPAESKIAADRVAWNVVGYVETEKPAYPVSKVGAWPDPLLPARPFDVPPGQVQPVWINVRVPEDARPGLYRGTVTVRSTAGPAESVPLEVRVWDFAVPKQQHLETCFLLRPDEMKRFYRLDNVPIEMYEEWIDFCVDRRISLTLNDWPAFDRDMERLVARQLDRGGSAFCLATAWFQQGAAEARQKHNADQVARIKLLYDRAKARGWIDRAYIYCHDEIGKEQFPFARELYGELKKTMPDLRLMQTFYKDDPVSALDDVLDIWAPNTGRYRAAEFQTQQAKGDGVWWYVCCGPGKPFANLMIEWPAIDHRILSWQNWKYQVTGFLYWGLNVWRDNSAGDRRWPEVPWNPATWRNDAGKAHNGDGQLIYPGADRRPLSSVRLENYRDGAEDYEYLWLLRETVSKLRTTESAVRDSGASQRQALIAEAEQALAIDDLLVKDLTHFAQEPEVLRKHRARVARLIERLQLEARHGAAGGETR